MSDLRASFEAVALPPRSSATIPPAYDTNTVVVRIRENRVPRTAPGGGRLPAVIRERTAFQSLIEEGYVSRVAQAFVPTGRQAAFALDEPQGGPVSPTLRALVSLSITPHGDAQQIAEYLNARQDEFQYAYVPAVKRPCGVVPDPLRSRQWGHTAVRIDEARAQPGFVDADEITVAVVDTGVDGTHPDLTGAVVTYRNLLTDETDEDFMGHGTHVSGIIAATINNGIGIAGVCAARLAVFKALPRRGGVWDANAYYRALGSAIDVGAKVLNLSLGGAYDRGESDLMEDLLDAGIVVVAAMGNEYERGNPTSYPAKYEGVIAVGAVDEADRRAPFSCTGEHLTLVAPGTNILSTVPQHPTSETQRVMYDAWDGTSMATPYVSAAAALVLAKVPGLTPSEVRERLMRTADRVPWPSADPASEYGAGRLNIHAALQ